MSLTQLIFRYLAAMVLGAAACTASAQEFRGEHGLLRVTTVARGLENPWALAFLPDGRMLVTERPGRMRVIARDGILGAPLGNLPAVFAQGQGGLLDVVLDRDFATSRVIYFTFSESGDGGAGTSVARARLGAGAHLWVALGERGQRDRAQDLGVHLGKVVRIRADGGVPADNPFVGRPGALAEIWSYGHRNIQGAILHPLTGALWTVEHGARGGDEINQPESGRNYGWPVITHGRDYSGLPIGEGAAKAGMEQPVHYWDPSIAPSGMAYYDASAIPGWKGSLLVGSLKFGLLARLQLEGARVVREERLLQGLGDRVRDVRVGPDGLVY
ncbi:MAG: PQQ-dependent sugar dehydrogenase, partial [Betaproteobacteria bacterium]|nr:PQQ-dependent sugar dehydrogenase [Betaproteobacteria bacterium]